MPSALGVCVLRWVSVRCALEQRCQVFLECVCLGGCVCWCARVFYGVCVCACIMYASLCGLCVLCVNMQCVSMLAYMFFLCVFVPAY